MLDDECSPLLRELVLQKKEIKVWYPPLVKVTLPAEESLLHLYRLTSRAGVGPFWTLLHACVFLLTDNICCQWSLLLENKMRKRAFCRPRHFVNSYHSKQLPLCMFGTSCI